MKSRGLIAGIGNIFLRDDGFGAEVARRISRSTLPDGFTCKDFGIAGVHLAFELLRPLELLIVADAVHPGASPGTIYLVEPELDRGDLNVVGDAHGMDLPSVFSAALSMGARLPRVLIVGCEPEDVSEGIGLSPAVAGAIDRAVELVGELLERELQKEVAT